MQTVKRWIYAVLLGAGILINTSVAADNYTKPMPIISTPHTRILQGLHPVTKKPILIVVIGGHDASLLQEKCHCNVLEYEEQNLVIILEPFEEI